jgi:hypothetical protein
MPGNGRELNQGFNARKKAVDVECNPAALLLLGANLNIFFVSGPGMNGQI